MTLNQQSKTLMTALGATILGLAFVHQIRQDAPSAIDRRLIHLDLDRLNKIVLKSIDETRLLLERQSANTWSISKDSTLICQDAKITPLLGTLSSYQTKKIIEKQASLEAYGLDTPQFVLDLHIPNSTPWSLAIGRNAPTGFAHYLNIQGQNKVYLGSRHLALVLKQLNDAPQTACP